MRAWCFQRKIDLGRIRSAAGRSKFANALEKHLIPELGDEYVDEIHAVRIKSWQSKIGALIKSGKIDDRRSVVLQFVAVTARSTTISTRRFIARPSVVLLSATGRVEPTPCAVIAAAATPRTTR
jgi:hypothetical protein